MNVSDATESPFAAILRARLSRLQRLLVFGDKEDDLPSRLRRLDGDPCVYAYWPETRRRMGRPLSLREEYAVKVLLAMDQNHLLAQMDMPAQEAAFDALVEALWEVEEFYSALGGLVGYQQAVLTRLLGAGRRKNALPAYLQPVGPDLTLDTDEMREAVLDGLRCLPLMAEIYPIGGAGDRLGLIDERTGEALPAACLPFNGKTLLEGLLRDLAAREYLYWKVFGAAVVVPVVFMTSHEKHNHSRILAILEENRWFGRPQSSYRFCVQPLVPLVDERGDWVMTKPLALMRKPGGHGVLWKLLQEGGVLAWLKQRGVTKALVRQINNPVAGTDDALLAFCGWGFRRNKSFGFASCARAVGVAEGTLVLKEEKVEDGYRYSHCNIEYTDFAQQGVEDVAYRPGCGFSRFPSNTNILFVDLQAVSHALQQCPFPSPVLNMKSECQDAWPTGTALRAGRLESTMQNLSDCLVDERACPVLNGQNADLKTYVSCNDRRKTISVTKKAYVPGGLLPETPEGCFRDMQANARDLAIRYCHMRLPAADGQADPVFSYHPALGPSYRIIAQKIRRGCLAAGSELVVETAEADLLELQLEGSLLIQAEHPAGWRDAQGRWRTPGMCTFHRVTVKNRGLDPLTRDRLWRCGHLHLEAFRLRLEGDAEFEAKDVAFHGPIDLTVPAGHRMIAYFHKGKTAFRLETLDGSPSSWRYALSCGNRLLIARDSATVQQEVTSVFMREGF